MSMTKRAAIYVRVSTDKQTIENQLRELHQIAKRRGWEVVKEYRDAGISGSKGREARPGLDEMLNDAQRRRFDIAMAWAIDRLGRSLLDLLGTTRPWSTVASTFTSISRRSTQPRQPVGSCFRLPVPLPSLSAT
jgi:predicted site-specific integrase-resolvase